MPLSSFQKYHSKFIFLEKCHTTTHFGTPFDAWSYKFYPWFIFLSDTHTILLQILSMVHTMYFCLILTLYLDTNLIHGFIFLSDTHTILLQILSMGSYFCLVLLLSLMKSFTSFSILVRNSVLRLRSSC